MDARRQGTITTTCRDRERRTTRKGARDRLRRAGFRNEPVVIETTNGYLPSDRAMTDMVAEMWEHVGVNVLGTRERKDQTQTFKGSGGPTRPR